MRSRRGVAAAGAERLSKGTAIHRRLLVTSRGTRVDASRDAVRHRRRPPLVTCLHFFSPVSTLL